MKKILTFFVLALASLTMSAASTADWTNNFGTEPTVQTLPPDMVQMGMDEFLTLTPKKYKEMTGKKLGLKKTVQLKVAQKLVKKHMNKNAGDADIPKGLYVVGAILGWGWLLMGLMDDWEGKDWWTNLILTVLCWLPGVIHALIKMKKYY